MTMRVIPNSPAAGGAGDGGGQQAQCQEFVHAGAGAGGYSEDLCFMTTRAPVSTIYLDDSLHKSGDKGDVATQIQFI